MKKSLILASLLLAGTSSTASDYIELGYVIGATEFDNSNDTIDFDGHGIAWSRNTENYMLFIGFINFNVKSSKLILSNTEYSYDKKGTSVGIDSAYKFKLQEKIFFAPWLSYSSSSWNDDPFTKLSTGEKYLSVENSDTDLEIGIMFGYNLKDDVDSFAYVSYTFDDDLLESEDHDDHTLTFGIDYAISTKFILNGSYSNDLSNDDEISNSSSFSFSIGYIF